MIKNSKILVTEGADFIGFLVVAECLKNYAPEVTIYDNFTRGKMYNIKHLLKRLLV